MTERINEIEFAKVTWFWLLSYFLALTANAINLQLNTPLFLPPLALLVAFFWANHVINTPHLISAFFLGLLYDGLYDALLGVHALLFVLLMMLMIRIRLMFRSYRLWQQSMVIVVFMALYQLIYYFIMPINLAGNAGWGYWSVPLLAGLLWWPIYTSFRWITHFNSST